MNCNRCNSRTNTLLCFHSSPKFLSFTACFIKPRLPSSLSDAKDNRVSINAYERIPRGRSPRIDETCQVTLSRIAYTSPSWVSVHYQLFQGSWPLASYNDLFVVKYYFIIGRMFRCLSCEACAGKSGSHRVELVLYPKQWDETHYLSHNCVIADGMMRD